MQKSNDEKKTISEINHRRCRLQRKMDRQRCKRQQKRKRSLVSLLSFSSISSANIDEFTHHDLLLDQTSFDSTTFEQQTSIEKQRTLNKENELFTIESDSFESTSTIDDVSSDEDEWSENCSDDPNRSNHEHHLFPSSTNSVEDFAIDALEFCRISRLPENQRKKLLQLFKKYLPEQNLVPNSTESLFSCLGVKKLYWSKKMCGTCLNELSNGFCQTAHCLHENMKVPSVDIVEIVTFNISEQLKFLMNKNMKIIRKYQNQARNLATPDANDIVCAEMYQTFLKRFDELFVSLMIHADGVPLYKSKNYNAWPILGAMLELPPFARTKAENILLFGIWLGKQKPKFEMIFNELTDQLSAIKNVGIENGNEECVKVILPMLMGDMPALSTMVNFVEPASFYACMFCETKGIYNHDGHCIVYPYDRDVNLRTTADFKIRSELAASTSGRLNRERTVGHKGISVFQRILDVPLPHAIVIDAMHTVFLCHGKKLLVRLQHLISKENMIKLSKKLVSIRYIHDILRRPRSFSNVQKWKASEVRVFILYIGLPALVESLSDDDAGDLAMYVVILRFLHDHWNQSEHVKSIVSNLLTIYMKNINRKIDLKIHPPKFATISTHTHLHLPAQCTKFA